MPTSPRDTSEADRRLIGSGRYPGLTQLHQAVPLVERQHALIEEMRARSPRFVAGRILAQRTGTTVRTIERDITRLRAAGIPVEVKRGAAGGYRLAMLQQVPPLTFSPGEVAALVASLVTLGPYTSATAQTALGKLITAFGPAAGSPGTAVPPRQRKSQP